jgi:iron complex outermembrane receptor protein
VARATGLLAAFLFLLLPLHPAHAQPTTDAVLGGRVTDGAGDPVANANVALVGTARGTATDAAGRFVLDALRPGAYTVRATAVGYAAATQRVTLAAGDTTTVALTLAAVRLTLPAVEVDAAAQGLATTTLGDEALRRAGADLGDALRRVPGLGATRRGALGFDPNVRGLSETEVGVYIDGARSFPVGPLRMDSPLSHVDPEAVRAVEVVKGPYALTLGPGNLSAIRVTTDAPLPREPLAGALATGYDGNGRAFGTSGRLAGTQGRVGYRLHAAYRAGSDYEAGDGTTVPADYRSTDVRGQVRLRLSDAATLTALGGYQDQGAIDYPGRLLDAQFFRTGNATLRYDLERTDGLLRGLRVEGYAAQKLHAMDNDAKPTAAPGTFPNGNPRPPLVIGVESELRNVGGRVRATLAPADALALEVGADGSYVYRDARRPFFANPPGADAPVVPPFYDSDVIWPGVTFAQGGVYARATRRLGDAQVAATARLDVIRADADEGRVSDAFLANAQGVSATDRALDRTDVLPAAALQATLPLSAAWTVGAGVGTVARPADALERYSDRIPASKAQTSAEFQGTPGLAPERSTQGDVWIAATTARARLRVSGFARRLTNYITLAPAPDVDPLLPLSPPTVFRYVNGTATFVGGEVEGAVQATRLLALRAGGSVLWGRDATLGEPALGVMPPNATLGARLDAPTARTLYLDLAARLVARQPRTATARGETPTDGYALADVGVGAEPLPGITLTAGVENVFGTTYVNHLNARNPFTGVPLPEPGRVFTIGARYAF